MKYLDGMGKGKGELDAIEKEDNNAISKEHIIIEYIIAGVKRYRIFKEVFHNTKRDYTDQVIDLVCGFYNLEVLIKIKL